MQEKVERLFNCIFSFYAGNAAGNEVIKMSKFRYLTMEDRRIIKEMWDADEKVEVIAVRLGFASSAIYAELKRGYTGNLNDKYRKEYDPDLAERTFRTSIAGRGPRGPRKAAAK